MKLVLSVCVWLLAFIVGVPFSIVGMKKFYCFEVSKTKIRENNVYYAEQMWKANKPIY